MDASMLPVEVLCHGLATYDLSYAVDTQPGADEKVAATAFTQGGGGPAANAAVQIARLGHRVGFSGYLGEDVFGQLHIDEFKHEGVDVTHVQRGKWPTPIASVMVKPEGSRTLVVFNEKPNDAMHTSFDIRQSHPKVILFDGHEAAHARLIYAWAAEQGIITVLDAGSVREGTTWLLDKVDYVVASERFARSYCSDVSTSEACDRIAQKTKMQRAVITLGGAGLVWRDGADSGSLQASSIQAVDTNGAGDSFHGAFCVGLLRGYTWEVLLQYATQVAGVSCQRFGTRAILPYEQDLKA